MSKDELIKGTRSELRQGFNPTLKKFFIETTDIETENNMRIYLDKHEYEIFGKDIFQNIEYFKDKV
jgi:hypothetical protein